MAALAGRVALVTGGSRGLGRAIAIALHDAGAEVAVLARNAEQTRAVAGEVGGRAVVVDVADAAALNAALGELGPVDILVANAGVIHPLGRSAEVDADEWARALDINVAGSFRPIRAVLPGMLERGYGRVVTISSGAATAPGMPSASAYSVSKAALDMLTLHLADEYAGTGVTANAVRPGVVDTPMQEFMRSMPREQVGAKFHDRFHGLFERGELVAPEIPAEFVVRLVATDRTGEVLDVRDPETRHSLAMD